MKKLVLALVIGFGILTPLAEPPSFQNPHVRTSPASLSLLSSASAEEFVPWANKFFVLDDTPAIIVQDFGTVPHGTKLRQRFKVTNIYKVPMQIERPIVSCGCVEPVDWSKQLQPKEEGFLDLTMDTSKFEGSRTVNVQVRFVGGTTYHSTAVLQLRAFSRGDITMTPGQVDFGQVAVGQKVERKIEVYYNGQAKWQVLSGEANQNLLAVQIDPIAGKSKPAYRITVGLKPDAPAGPIQEQIILKTNESNNPYVTINVAGQVLAPFQVSPKPVKFEDVEVGQIVSKRIIISANKMFRLEPLDTPQDGFTAKVQPTSNSMQIVEVQFQAAIPGEFKKELILKTDTNEKIPVSIEGSVKAK